MGDADYEKEYLERKKRLKAMHKSLKNSRRVQEIYHKIMGSQDGDYKSESKVTN